MIPIIGIKVVENGSGRIFVESGHLGGWGAEEIMNVSGEKGKLM